MKVREIYTLPKWYDPDRYGISHDGVFDLSEQPIEWFENSFKENIKLEDWIIEKVWEGDFENDDLIGKRLAFLLELRDRDFELYRPMANEKDLIYSLQNQRPEIFKSYLKYSR